MTVIDIVADIIMAGQITRSLSDQSSNTMITLKAAVFKINSVSLY